MSCFPGCESCARMQSAVVRVIAQGGCDAVNHRSLALEAGLSKATAVAHYPRARDSVYDAYEWLGMGLMLDLADAFRQERDWEAAVHRWQATVLRRMSQNVGEARICFVEPVQDDRLRALRESARAAAIEFLAREYRRRQPGQEVPTLQFELMIGAGFIAIARQVSDGATRTLEALGPVLDEIVRCFVPRHPARLVP